jgi:protein SCO1/2
MNDHVTNRDARPRAVAAGVRSFTHSPFTHSPTYSRIRTFALSLIAAVVALSVTVPVAAQTVQMADQPGTPASVTIPALKGVGVDQKLDAQVPIDLTFVDDQGKDVVLGQYFGKRPVVLALVYYNCPMLCSLVQNSLAGTMAILNLTAGKDYDVVVVSVNPGETPAQAADAKGKMLTLYRHPGSDAGFHFLTGREENIKKLADAVGFRYTYDPAIAQYAHPAVITFLTPQAKVSRYLFGIDYGARDLKLAIMDAAGGQIGSAIDQALLYCYHYDEASGRYTLAIMTFVRLGGLLTLAGIGLSIGLTMRRQRRERSAVAHTAAGVH